MTARQIYGGYFTWFNQGVIFMICNTVPRPKLDEKAFRRRERIINFPFLYQNQEEINLASPEEKPFLKVKNYQLKTEFRENNEYAEQAMLYLLDLYLLHLVHNPKISIPPRFKKSHVEILAEGNPVLAFIFENYDVDDTYQHKIGAEVLRTLYNNSSYGKKRFLSKNQFPLYLKDHVKSRKEGLGKMYFLKKGGLHKQILDMENEHEVQVFQHSQHSLNE